MNKDKNLGQNFAKYYHIYNTNKVKIIHAYGCIKAEAGKRLHLVKGQIKLKQVESLEEKRHKIMGNHFSIADLRTT